MELIQILKALGDDNRLRILNALRCGAICVCELEEILEMSQSNVSRHLSKLTNAKIVTFYKEAKFVYYKIDEETLKQHPFIEIIINQELDKVDKFKHECSIARHYQSTGNTCEEIMKTNEV